MAGKGLYFHTIEEAAKEAKKRAQSHYATYYIYEAAREVPNLFCSIKAPGQGSSVKAKVLYDGSIVYFEKMEETDESTTSF